MVIVKMYSGGKLVKTVKVTKGLDYSFDDGHIEISCGHKWKYIWKGDYLLEETEA